MRINPWDRSDRRLRLRCVMGSSEVVEACHEAYAGDPVIFTHVCRSNPINVPGNTSDGIDATKRNAQGRIIPLLC